MFQVSIKDTVLLPNTSADTLQWNKVGTRKTLRAAKKLFAEWVETHGATCWVELLAIPHKKNTYQLHTPPTVKID